jgi:gamma-glutamyl:cysteine ligase YbdK (ATP-grasp superfamily)
MENYELSVFVFNKIRHLLPFFSVLSQNSPFHEETFRGNLSERTASKFSWKMTGIPQGIDNNFLSDLQTWLNATIKSPTPYFYAVRYPRIDIKTIENCSMDMVSDVKLIIALIDIYYRLTEKLKMDFLDKNPLPKELF